MGASSGICSYFGSRRAVAGAHILTVPYASLLHRETRNSLGLKLKGNVVVIDEVLPFLMRLERVSNVFQAHNLIEAINDVHSTQVSLNEMMRAHSQLSQYLEKYEMRLKRCNQINVRQILNLLSSAISYLGGVAELPGVSSSAGEQLFQCFHLKSNMRIRCFKVSAIKTSVSLAQTNISIFSINPNSIIFSTSDLKLCSSRE